MGMRKKIRLIGVLALSILWLTAPAPAARAEESLPSSRDFSPSNVARLRELKEKDPQAFEAFVSERKQQVKSRFREIRKNDPQKYQDLKQGVVENRMRRLRGMRRDNPEKFRQVMGERVQKFEKVKRENPERYRNFIGNHPRFEDRMQKIQPFKDRPEGGRPGLNRLPTASQPEAHGPESRPGLRENTRENVKAPRPPQAEFKNNQGPDFKRQNPERQMNPRSEPGNGPRVNGLNSRPQAGQGPGPRGGVLRSQNQPPRNAGGGPGGSRRSRNRS